MCVLCTLHWKQKSYWINFVFWHYNLPGSAVSDTQECVYMTILLNLMAYLISDRIIRYHFIAELRSKRCSAWISHKKTSFHFWKKRNLSAPITLAKGILDGNATYSMRGHILGSSGLVLQWLNICYYPTSLIASSSNADSLRFSPKSVSHLLAFNCT